jgi:CRISPR-associated protein Cmr6
MSTRIDRERQQFALREARTYQSKGGLDEVVGAVEGAALRVRQQGLPQVLTIWERGGRAGDYGAGEVAGLVHRWLTKGAPGDRLVAADALALVEALETASPAEVGTAELEVIEFLVQLKTILHGFAVARKRAASGAEQPRRSRTLDRQQGELDPDGGQSRDRNPPRGLPPCAGREHVRNAVKAGTLPPGAHAGLVFDRYLRIWPENRMLRVEGRIAAGFREFAREFNADAHQRIIADHLTEWHARMDGNDHVAREFRAVWRMATGIGAPHFSESGFTFDDVIGVPYLAAAAVKGLARRMARHLEDKGARLVVDLLGPDTEAETKSAGDLVFFPAMPKQCPRLTPDIVNCHHPEYYAGRSAYPRETESPVPAYFLSAEGGTYVVRIGSRSGSRENIERGFEWVRQGFEYLGVGAKTAAGYGELVPVS